jgi:hypothetical protein
MLALRRFSMTPLLAAAVVTGCGTTTEIDHAKAENLIRRSVKELGRTAVKTVSCPSGVEAKKGSTFTCHATLANGTRGTVTIHIVNDQGRIVIRGPSDYHEAK